MEKYETREEKELKTNFLLREKIILVKIQGTYVNVKLMSSSSNIVTPLNSRHIISSVNQRR